MCRPHQDKAWLHIRILYRRTFEVAWMDAIFPSHTDLIQMMQHSTSFGSNKSWPTTKSSTYAVRQDYHHYGHDGRYVVNFTGDVHEVAIELLPIYGRRKTNRISSGFFCKRKRCKTSRERPAPCLLHMHNGDYEMMQHCFSTFVTHQRKCSIFPCMECKFPNCLPCFLLRSSRGYRNALDLDEHHVNCSLPFSFS